MSSLIRVAKLAAGLLPYHEDMEEPLQALLQSFGISRLTADNLHHEGYVTIADLAFLDEEGAGFVNRGVLQNFLVLAHGQAQRRRLQVVVEKFVYLCRTQSDFDAHGDAALLYDAVLPTLDIVALAAQEWASRMDQIGVPPVAAVAFPPAVAPAVVPAAAVPAPAAAAVPPAADPPEDLHVDNVPAVGNQQGPQLAADNQPLPPPAVVHVQPGHLLQAPSAAPDPPAGQGSGLQSSRKRGRIVSSGSSSSSDSDADKKNQLPSTLSVMKDAMIEHCLLSGDAPYCSSVVMAFKRYVKTFRTVVRAMENPSDKIQREKDQLKIMKRNVSDRCRDGSTGIAKAIYEFLTDASGSKRTQGAMKCIKSATPNMQPQNQPPARFVHPLASNQRGGGGYRPPFNQSRGRGAGGMRAVPPNLRCFTCGANHFQADCPLAKK